MRAKSGTRIWSLFTVLGIALLVSCKFCEAQGSAPSNAYKLLTDRLESIVTLPLEEWRYHADVAHPEESSLDDTAWAAVKAGETWKTGPRVLRRRIELPASLNGYSMRGARVQLDLALDSNDFVMITVFSNGAMVSRTDADTIQPIVLTENAQPGDTFLMAIRIQCQPTADYCSRESPQSGHLPGRDFSCPANGGCIS